MMMQICSSVCASLGWMLAIFTLAGAAFIFVTNTKLWEVENIYDTVKFRDNSDLDIETASPIECAVTALTYNRSLALYDGSSNQCFLHEAINQTEMTDDMGVLYVQGDALRKNNGWPFSTTDKDNDGAEDFDCVENRRGPWWHSFCTKANLNGLYEPFKFRQSMTWFNFDKQFDNGRLRETRLMLKRP